MKKQLKIDSFVDRTPSKREVKMFEQSVIEWVSFFLPPFLTVTDYRYLPTTFCNYQALL